MKEAAIKAHQNRILYMSDITVIPQPRKPIVLIDPPSSELVRMSREVAKFRGLKEVTRNTAKIIIGDKAEDRMLRNEILSLKNFYTRRKVIHMEERQIADGSISHDGKYAIAVCQAFDERLPYMKPQEIVDDGLGDPIHEPKLMDRGFDKLDFLEDLLPSSGTDNDVGKQETGQSDTSVLE
jgi:phosphopantetheinyl transferase (holo-ACP synthase)